MNTLVGFKIGSSGGNSSVGNESRVAYVDLGVSALSAAGQREEEKEEKEEEGGGWERDTWRYGGEGAVVIPPHMRIAGRVSGTGLFR